MLSSIKERLQGAPKQSFAATETPFDEGGIISAETVTKAHSKIPEETVEETIHDERPNDQAQKGVEAAEAVTLTWSKKSLGVAYALMWLLYFVNGFQASITGNLSAFVTSDFESHSLIPVISIVSSIMGAATYMPLAKLLNMFDRSVGFIVMASFATLGLVLSATCDNIGTYCAAQVFYSVGFVGMIFSIDVITADTSTLRNRGLAYAFTSSPYIITAFAGPSASEGFYENLSWRWAYGAFSIILPVVALPMFGLLRWNLHKAKKNGLLVKREKSGRTLAQSFKHYVIEFDVLGVFLLTAGLALFLLPFSITTTTENGWQSASMIVMLVLGLCSLLAFGLVERYVAPVPFLPWAILASRTVLGACLLDITYQIAYYCWASYFTSYLQVVFGASISTAGYISSTFDVVSGVWLFVVGFAIKKTGRFRWLLYFAVPLYIIGVGLMIAFRQPNYSIGLTIMCQIMIAFAGGTMIIVQQVAVLSAADHNNVASVLAFLGVFGNSGGAIGNSISGAIWTHTLPDALQRYLPEEVLPDWETIYDSLEVQLGYEMGDPVRDAIIAAYAESQRYMLIAGTGIMCLSVIWMFVIRDVRLTKEVQNKGLLF